MSTTRRCYSRTSPVESIPVILDVSVEDNRCGNGVVDPGEECDVGGSTAEANAHCSAWCLLRGPVQAPRRSFEGIASCDELAQVMGPMLDSDDLLNNTAPTATVVLGAVVRSGAGVPSADRAPGAASPHRVPGNTLEPVNPVRFLARCRPPFKDEPRARVMTELALLTNSYAPTTGRVGDAGEAAPSSPTWKEPEAAFHYASGAWRRGAGQVSVLYRISVLLERPAPTVEKYFFFRTPHVHNEFMRSWGLITPTGIDVSLSYGIDPLDGPDAVGMRPCPDCRHVIDSSRFQINDPPYPNYLDHRVYIDVLVPAANQTAETALAICGWPLKPINYEPGRRCASTLCAVADPCQLSALF
jgi:hypothetical protein